MSFLDRVTVLVLTLNEAPNIGRTLDALSRFPEVVVLDSGSTDETVDIVARYSNARLVTRRFEQHAMQWNYGLKNCGIERPWVLALDADYLLSEELVDEVATLRPTDTDVGYRVSFRYCIHGRPLSATIYPSHIVLYRRDRGHYVQEGHTQRLVVEGRISTLQASIGHDDRKPLARWLASQQRYARLEADHLLGIPRANLRYVDKVRLTAWLGPPGVFFYTLLGKRCIFDGWAGLLYVLQRTVAEAIISAELVDRKLSGSASVTPCETGTGSLREVKSE